MKSRAQGARREWIRRTVGDEVKDVGRCLVLINALKG